MQEGNEELGMAAQAALNKRNKIAKANGDAVKEEPTQELPLGADPVEDAPEAESTAAALGAEAPESEVVAAAPEESEEEPIRIGGMTFKTQKEALAYAEKLEQDKLLAEAHAQGVREALASQQIQPAPKAVEEDDFETKFYSNPKETLREIQARARDEAVAVIRAETAKEKAWNEFLSEFPDIRRRDAEQVLDANAGTIGILPWDQGRKALAAAVYKEYDEIAQIRRPKTELTQKKPAISPSGGAVRGVTPKASEEKPLSFLDQVRKNKKY